LRLVPIPSDPCQTYRSYTHQFLGNIFFKHIPELENNPNFQCPVKHIKQLLEQEKTALKYQIAKETQQHKLLKENI
jgi:hypothetical protein